MSGDWKLMVPVLCAQIKLKYPHRYEHKHEPRREDFVKITPWRWSDATLFWIATRVSLFLAFLASMITLLGLFVIAASVVSVYVSMRYNWFTDLSESLISGVFFFPASFGYVFNNNCYVFN